MAAFAAKPIPVGALPAAHAAFCIEIALMTFLAVNVLNAG